MSRVSGAGAGTPAEAGSRSWEKPAAADDIVDPIDGDAVEAESGAAEMTDEEAEDVPLDVQFTDALSMLADGGHDYRSTPLASDMALDEIAADESDDPTYVEIDESSKDA